MNEIAHQKQTVVCHEETTTTTTTVLQHSEELEFDCPGSFDFKDPNVEDFNLNTLFGEENVDTKATATNTAQATAKPKLLRNRTRTKLYTTKSTNEKKVSSTTTTSLSPISKKKKSLKPVLYNKRTILNVNERLYNAAQRRQPAYKTLAELVQDFDKTTRVYEDEDGKKSAVNNLKKNHHLVPKSPKLLSKNRNRARTALSQLEQDELIARRIKTNTFKAQPINRKIFDNYATGIPKVHTCKKPTIKSFEFGFETTKRSLFRKEKMQAVQQSIENVNSTMFVFKARPVPASVFKKVPIMMRNNQLLKKQLSELCLNTNKSDEKMTSTVVKQNSDSTLTRIAKRIDQIDDFEDKDDMKENVNQHDELFSKSINENLAAFKIMDEESSFCEFKSLTNFESDKEYVNGENQIST